MLSLRKNGLRWVAESWNKQRIHASLSGLPQKRKTRITSPFSNRLHSIRLQHTSLGPNHQGMPFSQTSLSFPLKAKVDTVSSPLRSLCTEALETNASEDQASSVSVLQDEKKSSKMALEEGNFDEIDPAAFVSHWNEMDNTHQLELSKKICQASSQTIESWALSLIELDRHEMPKPHASHLPGGIDTLVTIRGNFFKDHCLDDRHKEGAQKVGSLICELFEENPSLKRDAFQFVQLDGRFVSLKQASAIEDVVAQETVHPVDSAAELRARMTGAHKIFTLKTPVLKHLSGHLSIALVPDIEDAHSVRHLLRPRTRHLSNYKTAVFYSVCAGNPGLRGTNIGARLISNASELLQKQQGIKNFVTLSPMPLFRNWLESQRDFDTQSLLRERVREYGIEYLLHAKDENSGLPLDPVARFHLSNGAQLYQVYPNGDHSPKRMNESFGCMVNYLYHPVKEERLKIAEMNADGDIHVSTAIHKPLPDMSKFEVQDNQPQAPQKMKRESRPRPQDRDRNFSHRENRKSIFKRGPPASGRFSKKSNPSFGDSFMRNKNLDF